MGYFLSKGLKFNEKTARTVSIETGTDLLQLLPFCHRHYCHLVQQHHHGLPCIPVTLSLLVEDLHLALRLLRHAEYDGACFS